MVRIAEENPITNLWEKDDKELLRELLTAGGENEGDQIRMLLHVRSLHGLSDAIASASNTGNFLAKVGIGLTIAGLILALVQFCSPRSIQLQATTQDQLQSTSTGKGSEWMPWHLNSISLRNAERSIGQQADLK